jgi:tetratricopeptide (TPR) repeat protein
LCTPLALDLKARARRLRSLGLPIALVLLMAAALLWRGPLLSLLYSNLGAVHQSQAELGPYKWPEWPIQDAVRRAVDLSRPVAEFEQALALDPRNATANRRLGMIELSLGEYEDALPHLEAAYAAEPASSTTRQLLGEALIANGQVEEGRALWAGVRNSEGQLAARVYWYGSIGDKQRAAWMKQAAEGR